MIPFDSFDRRAVNYYREIGLALAQLPANVQFRANKSATVSLILISAIKRNNATMIYSSYATLWKWVKAAVRIGIVSLVEIG